MYMWKTILHKRRDENKTSNKTKKQKNSFNLSRSTHITFYLIVNADGIDV